MRIGITGKAEQQLIAFMEETGITNPTHLTNLLLSYLMTNHCEEAITYARNYEENKQKNS
ncbi:hypothetical protein [Aquipseudomonas alcaligenes]|uniref:Uncharacterized protein n=1 Tax=Aquipseudomonas alcaligenes TaxID=43263 RepID=A0A1N6WMV3_AQUAC|nr:hypothetical protein [Pseudomonas alcaligenes]SIQ91386.1 hypothetical protein SAMN05878282_11077 [Pseudomonas alcaligenes]